MTNLLIRLRRGTWIILFAVAMMFLIRPSIAHAQVVSVGTCSTGWDSGDAGYDGGWSYQDDVTLCYNGNGSFSAVAENDYYDTLYWDYGWDNINIFGMAVDFTVYNAGGTLLYDSGPLYGDTDANGGSPISTDFTIPYTVWGAAYVNVETSQCFAANQFAYMSCSWGPFGPANTSLQIGDYLPTSTSLTVSPTSTSTTGNPVTFTVQVSPNNSPYVPTGTVSLWVTIGNNWYLFGDAGVTSNAQVDSSGSATFTISPQTMGMFDDLFWDFTLLSPGSYAISAAYNGDTFYDRSGSDFVTLVVTQSTQKTTPTVTTWPTASPIIFGQTLASSTLSGGSPSVGGTFAWTTPGTAPSAGTASQSVTFTPTDTVNYNTVTGSTSVTVNKATSIVTTWPTSSPITFGQTLASSTLSGGSFTPAGTFAWTAPSTAPSTGTASQSVTFTPTDTVDYNTVTGSTSVTVASPPNPDQGTVTLWVGSVQVATTTYGLGSTPTSVAAALAQSVVANSPVTVTAVNDALYIVATQSGSATNYAYNLTTSSSVYSPPSFASASGTLAGGSNGTPGSTSTTIYSYSIPTPPTTTTGYAPNSNLLSYTDSVMGSWSYTYDTLNRLTGGSTSSGPYAGLQMSWNYDAFGNRTGEGFAGTSGVPLPASTTAQYNANNQILPGGSIQYQYDAAGNVTSDNANQYAYDADGHVCAVRDLTYGDMTGYLYNAEGKRVAKGTIQPVMVNGQATLSCDVTQNGFVATNESVLGQSGEQLTEVALDGSGTMAWQHTNVYAAGALVASYDPNGLHFLVTDWLGSRRAQTDYAGNLEQTCQSVPFGNGESCSPTPTEHLFSGYQRDAESGNDYAQARYYASSSGRFLSPDQSMLGLINLVLLRATVDPAGFH